jgi:hypothetical protein
MRIPKLVKRILKVLPVLAVLAAVSIGLFMGTDLYQSPDDSQSSTPVPFAKEAGGPQSLLGLQEQGTCSFGLIYMSLPPKCRTTDGSFIQAGERSPFVMRVPGIK